MKARLGFLFFCIFPLWFVSVGSSSESEKVLPPEVSDIFQEFIQNINADPGFPSAYRVEKALILKDRIRIRVMKKGLSAGEFLLRSPDQECHSRTRAFCVEPVAAMETETRAAILPVLLDKLRELDDRPLWKTLTKEDFSDSGPDNRPRPYGSGDGECIDPCWDVPGRMSENLDPEEPLPVKKPPKPSGPSPYDVDCEKILADREAYAGPGGYNLLVLPPKQQVNWPLTGTLVLLLVLVSIWIGTGARSGRKRLNLLDISMVRFLFQSRLHPVSFQIVALLGWFVAAYLILAGSLSASGNPGGALLWGIWWALLSVLPLFGGRLFCAVCPISAAGRWLQPVLGREHTVPTWLSGSGWWFAALLLALFGLLNEGLRIEERPWVAGPFLLGISALALLFFLAFRGRAWCNHLCPVGAVQALLARLSFLQWGTSPEQRPSHEEKRTLRACSFGLNPENLQNPNVCSLCGDCLRGRENRLAMFLSVPDSGDFTKDPLSGETALLWVLLGHLLFLGLLSNDYSQFGATFYEHAFIVFHPSPPLPDWIPYWSLAVYYVLLLLACIGAVAGSHALLVRWAARGGNGLAKEDSRRFSLSLLPLGAAAFFAAHIPAFALWPDLFSRFWHMLTGGDFSETPLIQASDYPGPTLCGLRLAVLLLGFLVTQITLRATAKALEENRFPAVGRRRRAEMFFALVLTLILLALTLLPNTVGDVC